MQRSDLPERGLSCTRSQRRQVRLHGSYEALKYGSTQDGLTDLTGGVVECLDLRAGPSLSALLATSSLVTVVASMVPRREGATKPKQHPEKLANGVQLSVNYQVVSLHRMEVGDNPQFVRLKDPLGTGTEYRGAWGRESAEWNSLPEDLRKAVTEGEFYMTYQDFLRTFTSLEVVHLDLELGRDEEAFRGRIPWHGRSWQGSWQRGVTAGGCRNNLDTFHINPQLQITLTDPDDVIISLTQHSVLEPRVIGFTLYQVPKCHTEKLDKAFFKRTKSFLNSQYTNGRQVCARCALDRGSYFIIPTTFDAGQEGSFTLRVFSTKPLKLRPVDHTPAIVKSAIIKAPSPLNDLKLSSYEEVFLQVADEHKTVNVFELQELLETCLPNDYVKSCATLEVCRQIILALNPASNGRLRFPDYKDIMCSLKYWQVTYRNHTKNTAGILRAEKLRDCLYDVGFLLNTEILSLLIVRYMRKDGTLRFGDFVSCILHLSIAFATFDKKDPLQNGFIKLNLGEWVKVCLQC